MSNEPPWEEWSDHYINSEQWTEALTTRGIVKFHADTIGHYCPLPPSLDNACTSFRRLDGNLVIYMDEEPDLFVEENQHLLCSDAMKHIMAGICNLAQAGQVSMEITGDNYFQNTSTTWRPWHHVYSLCQAGKGVHHAPQVNRTGKYIVRLFYLGAWRRIYVDDVVPINGDGKCLLPACTRKQGLHGSYVQLMWAPLLAKALLRIASLTWKRTDELYGWNVYTCLTGWQQLKLDCSKLKPAFTWRLCLKLLSHPRKHAPILKEFSSDGSGDGSGYADTTLHTCASMLLLALSGTETTPIIVTQTLVFSGANIETAPPKLARWKYFRWKEWATNNGTYEEYRIHMDRILKFYYPLGRNSNLPPLSKRTVTLLEEIPKLPMKSVSFLERSNATMKKVKLQQKKLVDPTEWIDFKDIFPLIKHIEIFFKPSAFQCTIHVEDFLKNIGLPETYMASTLRRPSMRNIPMFRPKTDISWLLEPEPCVYLVIDSVAPKHIFISISILPENSLRSSRTSIHPGEVRSDAVFNDKVSIVGSLHSWKHSYLSEPVFTIKTGGSLSKIVALPAGKCLLCLWCYIPVKHLSILFASQTNFSLYTKSDAFEEMSSPGIVLERQSLEVMKRLKAVLNWQLTKGRNKFNVLHDLYRALMPDSNCQEIIRAKFYEALLTIACRVPEFRSDPEYKDIVSDVKSMLRGKKGSTVLLLEEQKLLKRILQNQPWITSSSQSAAGKKLSGNISEQSPKLARSSIFPIAKRDIRFRDFKTSFISESVDENLKFGVNIMKLICAGSEHQWKKYPIMSDINNLVCFKDFYGTSDLSIEHEWVPITKYVINHTKSSEKVTCLVTFATKLKIWNMTIVNNETLCEVPKLIKHFAPIKFMNGESYTVFVYAWLPGLYFSSPVTISWKLRIFAPEYEQIPHSCNLNSQLHCSEFHPRKLVLKEVKGSYLPNSRSIIFRTIFRCEKDTEIAIRVSLSNPFAKFMLTIKFMDEIVVSTHKATGELIIPVLKRLNDENKSRYTEDVFYTMEGILLHNSWLLSDDEIEAAIAYKSVSVYSLREGFTSKTKSNYRFSIGKSRATRTAFSVLSLNTLRSASESSSILFQNRVPLWTISVVVDKGILSTFTKDRRLEEKMEAMKLSWESEHPGRSELGKQLREEFISKRKSVDELLETQLPPSEQFTVLTEQKLYLDKCIRDDCHRIFSEKHAKNMQEIANAMLITKRFDAIVTNTLQYRRLQNLRKIEEWLHYRRAINVVKKKVKIKKQK